MTIVYVIGKASEKELENLILAQLSKSYRVTYIKSKSLVQLGEGYDLVVADFPEIKSLRAPECVVVMKSGGVVPDIQFPEKSIIVANSENAEQLSALKTYKRRVITCGAGVKDDLSYSGISLDGMGGSIAVSLNREIIAFSGRKIQPLEIPLKLDKMPKDLYYPIAFTALRLILDDFNSELAGLM